MMKRKLQVFVSSTFTDLLQERQAAVEAVLKAGHIPAGMELFTAGDKSQMKTIERWIDESDVYMLILGGRYGSVEPVSNISYTELEYDYAKQQGKAIFATVIKDDALNKKVKKHGTSVIEQERPNELRLFKEKVLSNISSFFSDEKDIKLCVHESLSDFATYPSLRGWVSGADVPDVEPLRAEIALLKIENDRLKRQAETIIPRQEDEIIDLEVIKTNLSSIEVNLPNVAKDKYKLEKLNLLQLLYSAGEVLVNGVTNQAGVSEWETFLYYNICPKLQLHGIVNNEPVPDVTWRRSHLTKVGLRLMAKLSTEAMEVPFVLTATGRDP